MKIHQRGKLAFVTVSEVDSYLYASESRLVSKQGAEIPQNLLKPHKLEEIFPRMVLPETCLENTLLQYHLHRQTFTQRRKKLGDNHS